MRLLATLFFSLLITSTYAQKLSFEDFERESKFNKRLLPRQGSTTKSDDQLEAEKAYVEKVMKENSSSREASDNLVKEGIKQLSIDPREAMYSFNNAYLVDSSNANVYWGYGLLYSYFKQYETAGSYFQQGLYRDSKNSRILNSMAKNYQDKYAQEELSEYLEQSIELLEKSYKLDEKNPETSKLLTKAYLKLHDCESARKYFNAYMALSTATKDDALIKTMEEKCK